MSQELATELQTHISCRRKNPDRRGSSQRFNLRNLGVGARRKGGRRACDQVNCYVDRYEPHLFFMALSVVIMSCVDAFMTLNLIEAGKAVEWNPLMAALIHNDIQSFIVIKYILTALSVLILVAHKSFTLFGSIEIKRLIYLFFGGYLTLNLYEVFLTLL